MRYLFGPVNSRRLGISLGIDLLPYKTCSLDCVYCECGPTTELTGKTGCFIKVADVLAELKEYLSNNPDLDVITFSGSGEPTLHDGIGEVIDFIKKNYPQYRVVVLTNSTLLWQDEIRKRILSADIIVPSLDAVSPAVFDKILRPAENITAEKTIDGILKLHNEFKGEIWLEIFIVPGINDTGDELKLLRETALQIDPERIQLNSLDRPGAEDWVNATSRDRLSEIAEFFSPLNVEIVGQPVSKKFMNHITEYSESILATLSRRPSTVDDLADNLNLRVTEVRSILKTLELEKKIVKVKQDRGYFYRLNK